MKKHIFLALLPFLLFSCKESDQETRFDSKTYEVVKETLEQQEKKNPVRFLQVATRDRKNLIGQTVVIGTIASKSTIAVYKDVEIKLSFFSKTGVRLDEGIETIYEEVRPGETVKFKTKYFAPKGTDSVAVKIMKAGVA
jgi:hypothetical protein